MAKLMVFRFKRVPDPAHKHPPEVVGLEATVNAEGWPTPQVVALGLDDEKFGDFRGNPGAPWTRELRYVDPDGTKSATPAVTSGTLPTNFAPPTPGDAFEIEEVAEEFPEEPAPE